MPHSVGIGNPSVDSNKARESERGSEATVHAHLNRIKAAAVPALRAFILRERRKERKKGRRKRERQLEKVRE